MKVGPLVVLPLPRPGAGGEDRLLNPLSLSSHEEREDPSSF